MEELLAPRRSSYVRAFLKGVLRSIVKPIALVRIWYKRDRLRGLIVFCLLLGGYYYLTGTGTPDAFISTAASSAQTGAQPLAIEAFVTGQLEHNAAKAWSGMNPDYRTELILRGESTEKTQLFMDAIFPRWGFNGTEFAYVGQEPISEGTTHFYVGTYRFGGEIVRAPVTITLDERGMISSIASQQLCDLQMYFTLYCAVPSQQ
jgi:hypothetical protein